MKITRNMVLRLAELKNITDCFLKFASALGRPLFDDERDAHKWIAAAWEKETIRKECLGLGKYEADDIDLKTRRLRELFFPDPVRRSSIRRKPDLPSKRERDVEEPLHVVKGGEMTDREAAKRLTLLRWLVASSVHVIKELSVHEGATRGLLLGRRLSKYIGLSRRLTMEIELSSEQVKQQETCT